ncbi:MAG: Zn-ribbon domain-containing protein [Nanoarchaeota archaeon]|nr:Zn-ribbon domain-containing protein [Nanoarchaeota archaeon]
MPHQCVRCNTFYEDGSSEILKGCSCGSKLFFYIKKESMKRAEQVTSELSPTEKKQIEKDVFELMDIQPDTEAPVILDFEAIRISKPGKFEIDLVKLFDKKNPMIYKLGDGKYMIDVPETFQRIREEAETESKKRKNR